jgi:uncharacterized damage-inducible protein DinB
MIPLAQSLSAELKAESAATRRLLERVPEDRFDWRPHPRAMTLGQLAQHVAAIPGSICRLAQLDGLDGKGRSFEPATAESRAALLATLDQSVTEMAAYLDGLTDDVANAPWSMSSGDQVLFTVPRAGMLRTIAFNHLYHHRGQLCTYLRMLDVAVPVVYGRSADESPFA